MAILFAEALEAVEKLDDDGQLELAELIRRRVAERGRERVVASVAEARREFAAGLAVPMSTADILAEALS